MVVTMPNSVVTPKDLLTTFLIFYVQYLRGRFESILSIFEVKRKSREILLNLIRQNSLTRLLLKRVLHPTSSSFSSSYVFRRQSSSILNQVMPGFTVIPLKRAPGIITLLRLRLGRGENDCMLSVVTFLKIQIDLLLLSE